MPVKRVPPDKEFKNLLLGKNSEFIEGDISRTNLRQKKGVIQDKTTPRERVTTQVVDQRSNIDDLPSNVDSSIAAEHLKNELLGKLSSQNMSHESLKSRRLSVTEREGHNEQVIESSKKITSHSLVNESTSKRFKQNAEELIVPNSGNQLFYKPSVNSLRRLKRVINLPPIPTGQPIQKPKLDTKKLDLVKQVEALLLKSKELEEPLIRFDISKEAANHNFEVLRNENFNLDKILNQENHSVTAYGSEFKNVDDLEHLLHLHPRWTKLKNLLQNGSNWSLEKTSEELLKDDLDFAIKRGNHKSAELHADTLSIALSKEIKKGWELILPIEKVMEIPNLILSPMGVVEQMGVTEDGSFALKHRVTHDLSFPGKVSGQSINSRVIEENLEPCMFGYTLLRIIHRIVHLRQIHPDKIIWIRKEDVKSAYRRVHLNASTALKTAVQMKIEGVLYLLISLRLPFGGSPCPSEFCLLSDIITDTINDLMKCEDWNPEVLSSDYVKKIPPEKKLDRNIPFAQAKDTSVPNLDGDDCKADVFIDDIITVGVDTGTNLQKIVAGPCTIMHALAQHSLNDPFIPRQDFISDDKNEAEGAPEEVKITLGWVLDTRRLLIQLPKHKFKAWSTQVDSFTKRKSACSKDLQSILGRLENIAIIIPMFGHFLNNIRQTEIKATISNKSQKINNRTREDFVLAKKFIEKAYSGVNMNLMTFRVPTKIYINDASEHGLGGFATHSGKAWNWVIPEKLRGRAHINLLEFLAQVISIWVDVINEEIDPLDCLLGMGDNTASMGWLRRTNFRENDESDFEWLAKQKVARKLANLILDSDAALYRQWFRGADNDVADSLSRDAYFLSHSSHENFLNNVIPHQVPINFKVHPLPNAIVCFVSSILLLLPVKQQRLMRQKPSDLVLSNAGKLSSCELESIRCFLSHSQNSNKTSSCLHSHKQCEKPPSLEQIKQSWWKEQSVPPSHLWHRPSGQTTGLIRDWTWTAKCALSCRNNLEAIETKMVPRESRKHCQ